MGRPKADPLVKRSKTMAFKFTPPEAEAFTALKHDINGPIPVKDSDVIRYLISEACARRGIAWPGGSLPTKTTRKGPKR